METYFGTTGIPNRQDTHVKEMEECGTRRLGFMIELMELKRAWLREISKMTERIRMRKGLDVFIESAPKCPPPDIETRKRMLDGCGEKVLINSDNLDMSKVRISITYL